MAVKRLKLLMLHLHQAAILPLSRETNTDVTKTVIHRLATRGGLQKGVSPIDPPPPHVKTPKFTADKSVYSLVQKVVLVYIDNFALHYNCEGGGFL